MSSKTLPGVVTGTVPLHFVVYSFVSGLMMLFFSPMRFLISASASWVLNPFQGDVSIVLQNSLAIFLLSLCLGTPVYLLYPVMAGRSGVNERLGKMYRNLLKYFRKKDTDKQAKKSEPSLSDYFGAGMEARWWKWLKTKSGLFSYFDFFSVKRAIVDGLLIGSEVAFFLQLVYIGIVTIFAVDVALALFCLSIVIASNLQFGIFSYMPLVLEYVLFRPASNDIAYWTFPVLSPFIFLAMWQYNLRVFKSEDTTTLNSLRCSYIDFLQLEKGRPCFIALKKGGCPLPEKYKYCKLKERYNSFLGHQKPSRTRGKVHEKN